MPFPKGRVFKSLTDRFWEKVNKQSGTFWNGTECWAWTARLDPAGYARIQQGGRDGSVLYGHRLSYEMHKGAIPPGHVIDHLCRNRWCVNPDHLEAVTDKVNVLRGEHPAMKVHRSGRCSNGHELTPENTYYRKDRPGQWNCRQCRRDKRAAARTAKSSLPND